MSRPFKELIAELPPEQQDRIAELSHALIVEATLLRELRFDQDVTQEQLAAMMGIRQASLSKIEHQDDLLVSTLRRYVEALGGDLEILARFPDRTVALRRYGSTPTTEELPQPDLASVAR
jgi:transcriptional regulator with XRE-family HTH domain